MELAILRIERNINPLLVILAGGGRISPTGNGMFKCSKGSESHRENLQAFFGGYLGPRNHLVGLGYEPLKGEQKGAKTAVYSHFSLKKFI